MNLTKIIYQLLFYWISSFIIASIIYYLLWFIMPNHYVFGGFFRMPLYHWENPIQFILIPCIIYGILAVLFSNKLNNANIGKQLYITFLIIFLTTIISSPFGGMLYFYYDMKAGFYPINWISRMIDQGLLMGLEIGWLIILTSIPYNIIGSIICYFLTKKGNQIFK